ncbi:DUF6498-containing protein [Leeuwenhoekiella parthenopeia]|uniref:DUF6498-containing protein n=1 Tax=Leeuwenhoekiella parthenopeia TaxID=2890320 RepID=A0ABS8GSV1_9FLAO|nr:DUF6498-containing protein [Leeuwenhoekiella parthenopeia]MCC4212876.1 DUF6498-containing protein [Leeuwenhoekiella parthenopeia]
MKTLVFELLKPNTKNYMVFVNALFLLVLLSVGFVSPLTVVMAYFVESIIIGIFNVLKMGWCVRHTNKQDGGGLGNYSILIFFVFHYGFFIAIQSIFAFTFFEIEGSSFFTDGFALLKNYKALLRLEGMWLLIASIVFTNLLAFVMNFLAEKRYTEFTANELMSKPYLRIFVQQFVVILSGFFLVFLKAGMIAAVLLILFRLALDLFLIGLRENTEALDRFASWYAEKNSQMSFDKIKKQLLLFTE